MVVHSQAHRRGQGNKALPLSPAPQIVSVHCASADGCTAAITCEGALFTWGDGAPGNLGHPGALRQFIPGRVEGALLRHVIVQASPGIPLQCPVLLQPHPQSAHVLDHTRSL